MSGMQDFRPRFFEGQYLGAEDLSAAVDYSRIQMACHALGAHTWGIAIGLQLKETHLPGGRVDVHILPGYAWDGFGRPIVMLAPHKIQEALFSDITFQAGVDDTGEGKKGRRIPIWLRYNEAATQNVRPGFEVCDKDNQHSRVRESFLVEIGAKPHANQHDLISLAGQSVDAEKALKQFDPVAPLVFDESIPHQLFPEARERARWLIPIGYVRWLPEQNQPGHFVPRDDSDRPAGSLDPLKDSDKIRAFRRYIGVVAEAIEAADGAIRLRDRAKDPVSSKFQAPLAATDPTKPPDNELVWVEGHLRVEGHIKLHTDGSLFAPGGVENLSILAGRVNASGTVLFGKGFSASKSAVGVYNVLFSQQFPQEPIVVANPVSADGNDKWLSVQMGVSGFKIITKAVTSTGTVTLQDTAFTFIAIGLRG